MAEATPTYQSLSMTAPSAMVATQTNATVALAVQSLLSVPIMPIIIVGRVDVVTALTNAIMLSAPDAQVTITFKHGGRLYTHRPSITSGKTSLYSTRARIF